MDDFAINHRLEHARREKQGKQKKAKRRVGAVKNLSFVRGGDSGITKEIGEFLSFNVFGYKAGTANKA